MNADHRFVPGESYGVADGWARASHTANGVSHDLYRKGTGPAVVLLHELTGITPEFLTFADEVVNRGYTVVAPRFFGTFGRPAAKQVVGSALRICLSAEFTKLKVGVTSPVADWLRSLARELHSEMRGRGVAAVGMCFTGGFALAMMVDDCVAAPVVAQPSLPFPVGKARAADLGLSPADLAAVRRRVSQGCPVLGLRYRQDRWTGTRFDTLTRQLGAGFIAVELEGKRHSTLTEHRHQRAVGRVLDFLDDRLMIT